MGKPSSFPPAGESDESVSLPRVCTTSTEKQFGIKTSRHISMTGALFPLSSPPPSSLAGPPHVPSHLSCSHLSPLPYVSPTGSSLLPRDRRPHSISSFCRFFFKLSHPPPTSPVFFEHIDGISKTILPTRPAEGSVIRGLPLYPCLQPFSVSQKLTCILVSPSRTKNRDASGIGPASLGKPPPIM